MPHEWSVLATIALGFVLGTDALVESLERWSDRGAERRPFDDDLTVAVIDRR